MGSLWQTETQEAIARWLYGPDRRLPLHGTQDCFRGPGEGALVPTHPPCPPTDVWPPQRGLRFAATRPTAGPRGFTGVDDQSRDLHARVKGSPLYDEELGMYKVNAPLEGESHEIGRCRVVYRNPRKRDTFADGGLKPDRMTLRTRDGQAVELDGCVIGAPYAEMVRADGIEAIHVFFE